MSQPVEIVGTIDLDQLCQNSLKIYQQLMQLRRDKYEPHQKILVNYTEQDYFYFDNPVGFVLNNFLSILYHVDISLSQIVFFTTHTNINEGILPFLSNSNDVPEVHLLLVSTGTHRNIRSILAGPVPGPKNLKYQALCMLGTHREHRRMLYKYLVANRLLEHVQISINNPLTTALSIVNDNTTSPHNMASLESVNLVYSFPPRTVECWGKPVINQEFKKLIQIPTLQQFVNTNIPANGHEFYQHYAVDIVTETNFHYPSKFVSEKTLRPLLLKTPFLIFGPLNFLEYLRSRGFHTFSDVWDESYDQIANPQDRFVACCNVVNTISRWSISHWEHIYNRISKRLDHNRRMLLQYIDNDLTPLATKFNYPLE